MPQVIRIEQLEQHVGQEITIKGWVYNRTHKGRLVFLLVRDGYGFAQCVAFKGDLEADLFDAIVHVPQESSVVITGIVRADARAPGIPGGFDTAADDPFPVLFYRIPDDTGYAAARDPIDPHGDLLVFEDPFDRG